MNSRRKSTSASKPPHRSRLRITRVYTRKGDGGRTRLAGGQLVWKDDARVEAYGTVDELNAQIGLVLSLWQTAPQHGPGPDLVSAELEWVQHKLFDLGGILATAPGQTFPNMPRIEPTDVTRLERRMDACQQDLRPLEEFILPGGGVITSVLHVARVVCRRAERACVHLGRVEAIDPLVGAFLNRLSDTLFVFARYCALKAGEPERVWKRNPS